MKKLKLKKLKELAKNETELAEYLKKKGFKLLETTDFEEGIDIKYYDSKDNDYVISLHDDGKIATLKKRYKKDEDFEYVENSKLLKQLKTPSIKTDNKK
ncbi:hypothetical protein [Poseidonibacter ostreae]|uniref:Uncharacterized protein n=1 Tax=Poseidonibacter ostreae TaxID=2654171 RepID=A0A6L4WX26_9BACT|nr:hypothetical protein [Poseidonibacter ostreae]KAB7891427.1 hypothetical protein GBG19_00900 [Poseidonibacter ostreae]